MKEYKQLNGNEFKLLFYFRQNYVRITDKRLTSQFLSETLSMCERTVKNSVKGLEHHGFISVQRSTRGNIFTLLTNKEG